MLLAVKRLSVLFAAVAALAMVVPAALAEGDHPEHGLYKGHSTTEDGKEAHQVHFLFHQGRITGFLEGHQGLAHEMLVKQGRFVGGDFRRDGGHVQLSGHWMTASTVTGSIRIIYPPSTVFKQYPLSVLRHFTAHRER